MPAVAKTHPAVLLLHEASLANDTNAYGSGFRNGMMRGALSHLDLIVTPANLEKLREIMVFAAIEDDSRTYIADQLTEWAGA